MAAAALPENPVEELGSPGLQGLAMRPRRARVRKGREGDEEDEATAIRAEEEVLNKRARMS